MEHTLGSEEFSRDVEGLASDNNNLLAVEELLCDCAGQTTQQVALAVDDNLNILSAIMSFFPCAIRFVSRTTGSKDDILPTLVYEQRKDKNGVFVRGD